MDLEETTLLPFEYTSPIFWTGCFSDFNNFDCPAIISQRKLPEEVATGLSDVFEVLELKGLISATGRSPFF